MEILPEPSSDKLSDIPIKRTSKHGDFYIRVKGSYALSWKPCQGDSSKLNLPDHRSVLTKPEVQTTVLQPHSRRVRDTVVVRDFYKKFYNSLGRVPNRCNSSIGKTRRLLSFSKGIAFKMMQSMSMLVKIKDCKMAKLTKSNKDKDLKISELKTKSKDSDKDSRSKTTQHEGTILQQDKDQDQDSRTQRQSNLHKSKEARFKYLSSGEIVSFKILS
ncbi:hypothetical protein Tco_0619786 [Tanacetum coccineum]